MRPTRCCCHLLALVACIAMTTTHAHNILLAQTPLFGGRLMLMTRVGALLRQRGHNVTMLLNGPQAGKLRAQLDDLGIEAAVLDFPTAPQLVDEWAAFMQKIWRRPELWTPIEDLRRFGRHLQAQCRQLLHASALERRLRAASFDVAVVDDFWNACALAYVRRSLDLPYVLLSSASLGTQVALALHVPSPPSYVPHYSPMRRNPVTDAMTLTQRAHNLYLLLRDAAMERELFIDAYQQVKSLLMYVPHASTRLFITHGGGLSLHEAVCHAVPVLGIPLFGNHQVALLRLVTRGMATMLDRSELTVETLVAQIESMLADESYQQNATRLQALHEDQPISPADAAVYWIEYVARHQGAAHLRPRGMDLNFFQYFMLDVATLFVAIAAATGFLAFLSCRKISRKRKETPATDRKNNEAKKRE
ncbi:PREDICTED: UDP-glucuronosyltransferase 1-4-like [Priapulus caudatus]|uniref:UDP-glucuronosyltransferase 1-4-like n=1 Tax=Priapulus caudatus TaxID=37621 RepID=A0ABM1F0W0_PRICU|nr:PREDICTED: UDP-glucuronosyltransferase 1-4-like [Priapulus caudatus]